MIAKYHKLSFKDDDLELRDCDGADKTLRQEEVERFLDEEVEHTSRLRHCCGLNSQNPATLAADSIPCRLAPLPSLIMIIVDAIVRQVPAVVLVPWLKGS